MSTIYASALVVPWMALAAGSGILADVDWRKSGELFTAIVGLTTMAAGALKASPRWDRLTVAQRRIVLAIPAVLGALFGALQQGMPITVAVINAATAYLASMAANAGERKHVKRKGYEQAPPPKGDAPDPVGDAPPSPADDDEPIIR